MRYKVKRGVTLEFEWGGPYPTLYINGNRWGFYLGPVQEIFEEDIHPEVKVGQVWEHLGDKKHYRVVTTMWEHGVQHVKLKGIEPDAKAEVNTCNLSLDAVFKLVENRLKLEEALEIYKSGIINKEDLLELIKFPERTRWDG